MNKQKRKEQKMTTTIRGKTIETEEKQYRKYKNNDSCFLLNERHQQTIEIEMCVVSQSFFSQEKNKYIVYI